MFLTKIIVSEYEIVQEHLYDNYKWHQVLCKAVYKNFEDKERFLFSVKENNREIVVLVLSKSVPSPLSFGEWKTKEIPENYLQYKNYYFEITLNPVKRVTLKNSEKRIPKIHVPLKQEELPNWFISKMNLVGCQINEMNIVPKLTNVYIPAKKHANTKKGELVKFSTATFSGTLKILDQELFKAAFIQGIGREKHLGFGLLTVKPIS